LADIVTLLTQCVKSCPVIYQRVGTQTDKRQEWVEYASHMLNNPQDIFLFFKKEKESKRVVSKFY
jgi:hypothetical protein